MVDFAQNLRGLILSATELRAMTDWPEALIEDYLTILENLIALANEVDNKNDILKTTTVVTFSDTPYTPIAADEDIFFNTTAGPIDATLPVGIDGTNYRMINVGNVGNDVNLIPALTDKLFGINEDEKIYDSEVLIMTFETDEGWY